MAAANLLGFENRQSGSAVPDKRQAYGEPLVGNKPSKSRWKR
jgi:hypothetical protein